MRHFVGVKEPDATHGEAADLGRSAGAEGQGTIFDCADAREGVASPQRKAAAFDIFYDAFQSLIVAAACRPLLFRWLRRKLATSFDCLSLQESNLFGQLVRAGAPGSRMFELHRDQVEDRAMNKMPINKTLIDEGGRATLFKNGLMATALAVCFIAGLRGAASQTNVSGEDLPGTHNMLVVGHDSIFLSHLPMFEGLNETASAFTSPHRYQVILQAELSRNGKSIDELYAKDRRSRPDVKMYTLSPEEFVLSQLFTPNAQPKLKAFKGTVFRGHLERGGRPIDGLADVSIHIKRVVHARMFDPADDKSDKLTYILFGAGQDLFLAHRIARPPDFDQVLSITPEGRELTAEEVNRGVEIVFPDRQNVASQRLRQGDALSGRGQVTGTHQVLDMRIKADVELYFEEGELLTPPTMRQTSEEKKSGF